ncbi:MAG: hypothetical protein WC108_08205 [Bacteroidales bacterium]
MSLKLKVKNIVMARMQMIGTHSPNSLEETLEKLTKKGRVDG